MDDVTEGEEALARRDWAAARALFEAALAEAPDDPGALDGLGLARFWLGDEVGAREARERAYVEHRKRADGRRAAAAALDVAADFRRSGNEAAWAGWLARAERCLEGAGICSERGTIEVERAKQKGEPDAKERHARQALQIARDLSDADLELIALGQLGVAHVEGGHWQEGMALLDEAMAAAMGGEASDSRAICDICCQTLVACDQIADLRRAVDWCRVVIAFTEQRNYTPLHAWCRALYAGVLITTGEWDRGERELLDALRAYDSVGGIGSRLFALARLAELRLRQGRVEEAERLLAGCEDHPLALLPVARLRLLQGEAATAAALIERRLDVVPHDAPGSGPLLPVLVEARLARGDLVGAAAAAERLAQVGRNLRRDNLVALGQLAAANVALARGDDDAAGRLQAALDLLLLLGIPFEAGEARLALAQLLAREGSELALEEARGALSIFERLGAARRADEAAAVLRSLGVSGRTAGRHAEALTAREREVLALLGEGLSNAEIAERLVISAKTAGHHVSHIFRKLGVRNRAEAAAYALREGPRADIR